MQRFATIAALAASAAAYQVKIQNNCGKPAYIWSCGDAVGDMYTLESGGEPWTEAFYSKDGGSGGPSIYVSDGKSHTSGNIAQLEYYYQTDVQKVWWDLSIINGNPFSNDAVSLGSDLKDIPYAACKPVQCSGIGPCSQAYQTHEQLQGTHDCPPSNLIMNLCDANGNYNTGGSSSAVASSSPAPQSTAAPESTPAPSPSSTPAEAPSSTPVQVSSYTPVAQSSEAPQPSTTAAPSVGNSYLQESDNGKPIVHTAYATTVVTQVVSVQAPAPSPDGVYVGSDNMVHGKREAHAHAHAHNARAHNSRLFRRHNHQA
ncbi:MAG: hypothetical protein MMC23_007538 [Stictis urceolatum]|nr:hypothetical protein [Stictis urceolata]